jgi:hypothetical protein
VIASSHMFAFFFPVESTQGYMASELNSVSARTIKRHHHLGQAASTGVQGDLMNNERWGWRCMLQLQEAENWTKPAATTWAAEFLLREGESRECLGSWINSSAVHEAKKRRAKQVITCLFPCGKWLHIIGARPSAGCELCKRERGMATTSTDALPTETVAHIQSAGCKARRKV